MEDVKKFFHGTEVDTKALFDMMMQRPGEAKSLLDRTFEYAWFLMEKQAIEYKYKHKMRELYEKYDFADEE